LPVREFVAVYVAHSMYMNPHVIDWTFAVCSTMKKQNLPVFHLNLVQVAFAQPNCLQNTLKRVNEV
jgi:hypothetical protein